MFLEETKRNLNTGEKSKIKSFLIVYQLYLMKLKRKALLQTLNVHKGIN